MVWRAGDMPLGAARVQRRWMLRRDLSAARMHARVLAGLVLRCLEMLCL